ncbi:uncharacterized protein LOC106061509 [Biomphalaria glabrata]|uniref:Uncharacterized protein LOC106061509 n=1 Tax=Biomphalaria glabrata TaxID=6526 RepID=A0A9U8E6Z2_BIOGL|nr:uncharacterized protein LOC106061509 [Biomphalaria glabrata]
MYVVDQGRLSGEILRVIVSFNRTHSSKLVQDAVKKLSKFGFNFSRRVQSSAMESNQASCTFPKFDPFDPNVVKFAKLDRETLQCNGTLPDLTYLEGNYLIVNHTKLKETFPSLNVTCKYRTLTRHDRDLSTRFGAFSKPFQTFTRLPRETEFILVVCEGTLSLGLNPRNSAYLRNTPRTNRSTVVSRNFFALIPEYEELAELENLRLRKRMIDAAPNETMNVIMIGFDSVPRFHFLRAMSKTYNFLVNDLQSYDFTMHSQVGKNSFPNFLPLLTGSSEKETNRWWDKTKRVDEFDLLWKDFERAGYRTMFTEDWPQLGTFNFYLPGFYKVPTVHYTKPISMAIEKDRQYKKDGFHCIGNQPEVLFHLNYLKRFLETFSTKPVFSLVYLTRIGHDDATMVKAVDDHVHNFYTQLKSSGHLNNTMLITFSDHGLRFGPLRHTLSGDFEKQTPFLILTLPPWFRKKYPNVAENLKANTGRLTSHYDTHATARDLLYFRSSGDNPLPKSKHGTSLFQEIPRNRTCTSAYIPHEFCMCGYQKPLNISANTELADFLSMAIISYINSLVDKTLCHTLAVLKLLEVIRLPPLEDKSDKITIEFRVKVSTFPGNGIFEACVQADDTSGGASWEQLAAAHLKDVTVGDGLDRLNMYRGQSYCVKDTKMKLFCYCKDLLKTKV